jgi:titin
MKKIRARVIALVLSALFISFLPVQSAFAYPSCTINGTAGNDVITGTAGNDVICAGGGNDTINSLAGNDTIIKGSGTAVINAGAGNDTIDASLATSVTIDAGIGDDIIIGSPGDDTIDAGDGMDDVEAGDGNDTLYGGSGDDSLDGGLGDNLLYGGAGDDIILGDEGKDTIYGDAGDDTIDGGDEADKLYGGAGNDTLIGGIDNDILYGGDGADYLYGDSGDDQLFGQAGIDALSGQQGDDLLSGGTEIDSLSGGVGVNVCDYTVGEATVTTCIYDSSAPVLSIVSISPDTVDVGSSASSVQIALSVTDATFISMAHIDCRRTGSTISIFSYDFNSSSFNGSASTSLSKTGDDKKLDVSFGATVPKGSTSGIYNCYLSSTDILGNSYQSEALKGFTIFGTPSQQPSAPRALTFVASGRTTGLLSWQAPTSLGSPELVTYVVQYSTDVTTWLDANFGTATKTSMSMTSLKADTNYWFRVRGENGGTVGQDTTYMNLAWVSATGKTALAEASGAPTAIKTSLFSGSGFKVDWTAPTDNGGSAITNYTVDLSRDGVTWVSAKSVDSTATGFAVSGLLPGTLYQVRIAAVTDFGRSSYLTGTSTTSIVSATSPSSLVVSSVSGSGFMVDWTAPTDTGGSAITNYTVELSRDGVTWVSVKSVDSTATGFVVSGLLPGTLYQVRIAAVTAFGKSSYLTGSVTTSIVASSVPTGFKSSSVSGSGLTIDWTAPSDNGGSAITNYSVEYSSDAGITWSNARVAASTSTQLKLSGLLPVTNYLFRIAAVTAFGKSAYLTGSVTTLVAQASAPTALTVVSVTSNKVTLAWSPPLANGGSAVTGYVVEISSDSGSTWTVVPRAANDLLGITANSLLAGKTYIFRVSAVTSFGTGQATSPLSVPTAQLAGPSAPSNFKVTSIKSTAVAISWKAPALPSGVKISNYLVDISLDGTNWVSVTKKDSSTASISISTLQVFTNYQIRVATVATTGISDYLVGYFTTLPSAPTPPSLISAGELGSSSFMLSWLPGFNGGSAVTNYIVEINGAGLGWVTVQHDSSANSSLLIQNLLPGVKYSARIKAVNSVGVSKVSTTLIVTTLPTVPSAVEALTLKSSTSTLTVITWKAPNNGGAKVTDYQVKYSMDQGQTWSLMTKAVSTATLLNIRGLKAKTNYWFTVEAKNSAGFSAVSQVLRVSTP